MSNRLLLSLPFFKKNQGVRAEKKDFSHDRRGRKVSGAWKEEEQEQVKHFELGQTEEGRSHH